MSDELPTAARVSDPGVRALYRLENRWHGYSISPAALGAALEQRGFDSLWVAQHSDRWAKLIRNSIREEATKCPKSNSTPPAGYTIRLPIRKPSR